MKLCVKLFAVARQRVGRDTVEVQLPTEATVGNLRAAIIEQFPSLAEVLAHARLAVDSEYASDASSLPLDAEVAVIPPVSGG